MLTLKLINEQTERVIRGLEKKHFDGAREAINEVMTIDKTRREAQTALDRNLSEAKKLAAEIGGLMKQGKKDEAEGIKAHVSELKQAGEALKAKMEEAEQLLTQKLCQIPNIPYDEVPEGSSAEDNWVVNQITCVESALQSKW